tara:strand:+ start:4420 stop:4932 length:513 start_codon:yes stop_codon:yes gene_type:complete
MKNFKLLTFILIILIKLTNYVNANDKLAIIDIDFILEKSIEGQKIINELNIINEKNRSILKEFENNIKTAQDDLKSQKNILSEEELNIKVNKISDDIKKFNLEKNKLANNFNENKNKKLDEFFKKILPIIENYITENNINVVIDKKNIFIANKQNNITTNILKKIDEELK